MYRASLIFHYLLFFFFCSRSFSQQVEKMLASKPVAVSGNISVTGIFYNASGIPNRYLPFNYVISGTPVLSLYGFQIPVSFVIGKQQSNFTQPFNQFGLSPSYKWLTLHAGYRNLVFSPYTLAGHTFLGAGVELNPGKFRFAAIYGQFNKATLLDTAQQLYFSNFAYKRTGMAVRVGYGTENNYFDIIGLKAKDDPASLKIRKGLIDSSGIAPAENTVAGYNLRLSFWHNRITLESNAAVSLYTNDINSPELQDSSFDKEAKQVRHLATVRSASELFGAVDASLRYKIKNFSVKFQYRHVDAGFQSMGAYFLNNDLENYTIAPAFTLLQRKLRFSGSLGIQRDDLADKKRARANKVIGSANASADFTERLGIDASYSNYSVSQTVKTIRFADSLKVVQSSSQLSVTPRYTIPGAAIAHTFVFSANLSKVKELNPMRADSLNGDINMYNYLLNYQVNLVKQMASVYVSFNHTELKSPLLKDGNNGVTLGLSKNALKNALTLAASGGWLLSKRNDEKGRIITGSLQCRYQFFRRHQFRVSAYYTDSKPDNPAPAYPHYTETRAEVGYGFSL
ncbi:MAG: hypothetical protein ABIQ88_02915 [Chitinophagaceae bacterium]